MILGNAKADTKAPLHRPARPDPTTMPDNPPKTPQQNPAPRYPPRAQPDPPNRSPSPSQLSPKTFPQVIQPPVNIPAGIYFPKVSNGNARTASFASLWCPYDKLWTDLTPCSVVPIVDSKTSN